MRIYIFFLFLIFRLSGVAQSHFSGLGGAHFNGLGRAGLTIGGISAMYNNQAGLSELEDWSADISYERRYNLEDLSGIQLSAAKKFGFGTLGVVFSQFGSEVYNEQLYGLAYGRKLSKKVSAGGKLSVLAFNGQQIGSLYTATFSVGAIVKIDRQFSVASHIFSPVSITLSEYNEIAGRFRIGLTYSPSDKVNLYAEVDKMLSRKQWEYKLGLDYQVIEKMVLMAGYNPNADFFGFGFRYRLVNTLDVRGATSFHQVLGLTPALSISYGE